MKRIHEFKGYRSSVAYDPTTRQFITAPAVDWPEVFASQPKTADVLLHRPRPARPGAKAFKKVVAAK